MTDSTSRVAELPATRAAPRIGREFLRDALVMWEVDALIETASLLVSEVVTNAVVHAQSPSTLCVVRTAAGVHVSVIDQGPGTARRAEPGAALVGGHGLALVDALAERWGAHRIDGGHEVWFDLSTPTVGAPTSPPLTNVGTENEEPL